jgi:hypothetical protein
MDRPRAHIETIEEFRCKYPAGGISELGENQIACAELGRITPYWEPAFPGARAGPEDFLAHMPQRTWSGCGDGERREMHCLLRQRLA